LEEHERYRIKEIGKDGEPIALAAYGSKFVIQCGVLIRDNIPITIREWKKTKTEPVSFVEKRFKNMLWKPQECKNCISGTWKPQRKERTRSH
jgi:hypothetical protein